MRKTWGIYKGVNPNTNPLNKWIVPKCKWCNENLIPWIDWVSHGSVGYCKTCNDFYVVKSKWKPTPNVHLRAEIEELVTHKIKKIHINKLLINTLQLWEWHEKTNIDALTLKKIILQKKKIANSKNQQLILIEHLYWSLILNSDFTDKKLAYEYIDFVFKNPHYYKIFNEYELWIGHEIDIIERLEKTFKCEMTEQIYEIWNNNKLDFSTTNFKLKIGFYVPKNDDCLMKYEDEFINFARKIRRRIF